MTVRPPRVHRPTAVDRSRLALLTEVCAPACNTSSRCSARAVHILLTGRKNVQPGYTTAARAERSLCEYFYKGGRAGILHDHLLAF